MTETRAVRLRLRRCIQLEIWTTLVKPGAADAARFAAALRAVKAPRRPSG